MLLTVAAPVPTAAGASQPVIRSLTPLISGHRVGGVTLDAIGDLYVADFGELVWKITPDGNRTVFATGLYGASGNTIDTAGNLLQASCYGNTITKIDRAGRASVLASRGLNCPVGVVVSPKSGDVYAANCKSNTVTKVAANGAVSQFAKSSLFQCPNGITVDGTGNLYVVNYRDNRMLKIDSKGNVSSFTTISDKGLGHLCLKNDRFYVTAAQSNAIYVVTMDGAAARILGGRRRGIVDGAGEKARLSFPNGIACDPWAPRLFIDEEDDAWIEARPPHMIVREIDLAPFPK
jgi:DNA-binding beta-propeller fold protein YncE